MMIWHPAPRGLVVAAATERWTRENPAPQLIAYLWIWSQYDDGERPTRRQVARLFGWTEYYAKQMLRRVKAEHSEWQTSFLPKSKSGHKPPVISKNGHLRGGFTHKKPDIARVLPDQGCAVTTQHKQKTGKPVLVQVQGGRNGK